MKHLFLLIGTFLFFVVANSQVLLYENHFESSINTPTANCAPDFDQTFVNTLWGGTGEGTGGGGIFTQSFTVETMLINGSANQYNDPGLKGGNYSIGMLAILQDDKLSLTLNSQGYPYINISFDLSAIGINGCGFAGVLDTPRMNIKLYDSPSGTFSFNNPGTLIDEKNVTGTTPGPDIYTFNWASVGAALNNNASGFITVALDLTTGNYASFDNLKITADSSALPLTLNFFKASQLNNTNVNLIWQTFNEVNVKQFDIEKSDNGISFKTMNAIHSKRSGIVNNYAFIDKSTWNGNSKYYRLKMIDRDGSFTYSPIIFSTKTKGNVEIFPNPAKTFFSINGLSETGKISLSGMDGRILFNKMVSATSQPFDISHLPNGIYILKFQGGNETTFFKLLKQ